MHANIGQGDSCTNQTTLSHVCIWVNLSLKIMELPTFFHHLLVPVHVIRGHKYEHKQNMGNVIV